MSCGPTPSYEATHQKTITVDGAESLILSANLTAEYYATTRDFGVFDTNPRESRPSRPSSTRTSRTSPSGLPTASDLVWSPGSQAQMLAVINGAEHTLVDRERGDGRLDDHERDRGRGSSAG